ncbi:MAG: hypothetical protein OXI64_09420 [Defluviicoccus sp.]|nr:hypothetical protein [Defluviicoccus sp.]
MNFDRAARRWAYASAALAMALALSGCGGIAAVGSAVASGAEAVGTVVKDIIGEDDKEQAEPE